jgi:hypothetical protein
VKARIEAFLKVWSGEYIIFNRAWKLSAKATGLEGLRSQPLLDSGVLRLWTDGDAERTAPRAGKVRSTAASGTANHKVLPRRIAVIDPFWSPCVVTVVHSAGGLVASLNLKLVVIGRKARVCRRAPLHLYGDARCTAAVGSVEVNGIHAARQTATWHRPSQAREENLVVPGDGNGSHPPVVQRIETGGSAGGVRRESNLRIGDSQVVGSAASREGNGSLGEINDRAIFHVGTGLKEQRFCRFSEQRPIGGDAVKNSIAVSISEKKMKTLGSNFLEF